MMRLKQQKLQISFINIFFPVINPDNTFEVLIDNKVVNSGSLLEDVRYVLLRIGGGGGGAGVWRWGRGRGKESQGILYLIRVKWKQRTKSGIPKINGYSCSLHPYTLRAPIMTAAAYIHKHFFIVFQRK